MKNTRKVIRIIQSKGLIDFIHYTIAFGLIWVKAICVKHSPTAIECFHKIRWLLFSNKFTDSKHLSEIYVDPRDIEYISQRRETDPFVTWVNRGHVKSGNWDRQKIPFGENDRRDFIKDLVNDGDVGDSIFDQSTTNVLNEYDRAREDVEELINSIREYGYLSQSELLKHDPEKVRAKNNEFIPPELNEVTVDIGRDGELLFRAFGQHRLFAAKALDLEQIPVHVAVRHSEWQSIRNEVREASDVNDLSERAKSHLNHPDLWSLISK